MKKCRIIIGVFQKAERPYYFQQRSEESEMTIDEASERYKIPMEVLKEYESWGLCGEVKKIMGTWQKYDRDMQRLSMIMTLHDIGFGNDEVECYMRLLLEGESTAEERLMMLSKKRGQSLDEIHFKQKQLDRMDYLRYKIRQDSGK